MTTQKTIEYIFIVLILVFMSRTQLGAQREITTELNVFAAVSLTEAFQTLGKSFEAAHPSVHVRFNFGGSQQLVQQIVQGAKADIFASANMKQMKVAATSGMIDTTSIRTFARNRLVIVLPKENPVHLNELRDLTMPKIKIVLADSSVPVGQYALQVLDHCSTAKELGTTFKAEVLKNVVSYEENVRAVLSKVQLGECDAGIVYTSDIVHDTAHQVGRIEIPDRVNAIAEYPIGVVRKAASNALSVEFITYILSEEGKRVFSTFGFIEMTSSDKR
jgi:molybdate transport system substrate-binding protein